MQHAITIGDVLLALLGVGGLVAIVAALFFVVWLFNPFRTGH